jgi:hypothetical protein
MSVAGTDPTPTNTRKAVPIVSATSFWMMLESSNGGLLDSECHSIWPNAVRSYYGVTADTRDRNDLVEEGGQ